MIRIDCDCCGEHVKNRNEVFVIPLNKIVFNSVDAPHINLDVDPDHNAEYCIELCKTCYVKVASATVEAFNLMKALTLTDKKPEIGDDPEDLYKSVGVVSKTMFKDRFASVFGSLIERGAPMVARFNGVPMLLTTHNFQVDEDGTFVFFIGEEGRRAARDEQE